MKKSLIKSIKSNISIKVLAVLFIVVSLGILSYISADLIGGDVEELEEAVKIAPVYEHISPYEDRTKEAGHFKSIFYSGAVNVPYNGEYIPVEEYINFTEDSNGVTWTTLDGKSLKFNFTKADQKTYEDLVAQKDGGMEVETIDQQIEEAKEIPITSVNVTANRGSLYYTIGNDALETDSFIISLTSDDEILYNEESVDWNGFHFDFSQPEIEQNLSVAIDESNSQIRLNGSDIQLIDPYIAYTYNDSYDLDDSYTDNSSRTTNYGTGISLFTSPEIYNHLLVKFNLSSVSSDLHSATLQLYSSTETLDAGEGYNMSIYQVYSFPDYNISNYVWDEHNLTWNNAPNRSLQMNMTPESKATWNNGDGNVWVNWTITNMVKDALSDLEVSMLINSSINIGSPDATDWLSFMSKENSAVANRPRIVVYYDGLIINSPIDNQGILNSLSTNLNTSQTDYNQTIWYTWNKGIKNYTLCATSGECQGMITFPKQGYYNLTVYGNNSGGNITSDSVSDLFVGNFTFQEVANWNISTGTWAAAPNDFPKLVDGNWSTYAAAGSSGGDIGYAYINYSSPLNALYDSQTSWQIKNGYTGTIKNLTLSDCISQSKNLSFRIKVVQAGGSSYSQWSCYNYSLNNYSILETKIEIGGRAWEEAVNLFYYSINVTPTLLNTLANNSIFSIAGVNFTFNISDDNDYLLNYSLYLDGALNATVNYPTITPNINNSFQFNVTGIAQGAHTWYVQVYDSDGNQANSQTFDFIVDLSNPLISFGSATEGNFANKSQSNIYINTSWTETNFKNITFIINSSNSYTSTAPIYSYNFTSLADGTYYYNVTLCDLANNCNTTTSRTITLDRTPPTISIASPLPITYSINNISLNYSVTDSLIGLSSCWYRNDTGENITITCNTNTTITQADGSRVVYFWANDSLNNVANTSVSYSITTSAPAITLKNPTNNKALNYSINILFNFTVEDTPDIDTCELWGNWTGTWHKNQSITSVTKSVETNFNLINISQGVYIWNVKCNDTSDVSSFAPANYTLIIDITNPNITLNIPINNTLANTTSQNLTANLSDNIGIKNATIFVYNQTGFYNSTVAISNDAIGTITQTMGVIINLIDGVYNWFYSIFDFAGNTFTSSNYTITTDTTNPSINFVLPTPLNNSYFALRNIEINVTVTDANLKNITIYLYNSTALINSSNSTTTPLYANFSVGYDGVFYINATAYDLVNHTNATLTRKITLDNFVPSNNIYLNKTPPLFDYITIRSNLTISNLSNMSYCNFTLVDPSGNYALRNNKITTMTGIVVESGKVYLNQSGTYNASVLCVIENGYNLTQSTTFNLSAFALYSQPPFNEVYSFSAVNNITEKRIFNLSLYGNTNGSITFNVAIDIYESGLFTLALSDSAMTFNSTYTSVNPNQLQVSINGSAYVDNGTYAGTVNFSNSTYGLEYIFNYSYGISPPSGIPDLLNSSGSLCYSNSSCYNSLNMDYGKSYGISYVAKNTGLFRLSNCNLRIARTYSSQDFSSWSTNSQDNFDLEINETKDVGIVFTPADFSSTDSYYAGNVYLFCGSSDILGHNATTNIVNRPFLGIYITFPQGYVGGGGGGAPFSIIPTNVTNVTTKAVCGDGICQNPLNGFPHGNDYNISESFQNCPEDCPAANIDTLFKGCIDAINGKEGAVCVFSQAVYQYVGLIIIVLALILIFGTADINGQSVPLYRYSYIKLKAKFKK